jgi:hypothetical protein
MNSPKSLSEFKEQHCNTLISDPKTNSLFVKVPIENYEELYLIKSNLLTAIKLIADSNEYLDQKSDVTHSIGTLVQLIRSFGLADECDGLTELMKEKH